MKLVRTTARQLCKGCHIREHAANQVQIFPLCRRHCALTVLHTRALLRSKKYAGWWNAYPGIWVGNVERCACHYYVDATCQSNQLQFYTLLTPAMRFHRQDSKRVHSALRRPLGCRHSLAALRGSIFPSGA